VIVMKTETRELLSLSNSLSITSPPGIPLNHNHKLTNIISKQDFPCYPSSLDFALHPSTLHYTSPFHKRNQSKLDKEVPEQDNGNLQLASVFPLQ